MPLQLRRGADSDRTSVTPVAGEPLWVTDTQKLYIGDGSTAGGVLVSGGTDSAAVIALIDSAYVQARQVDVYRDSAFVTTIVDSAYINARTDANIDSAKAIALIDSAYVQQRQDYAYSSLTGAPTNVSSFTNDAGYTTYDSANTTGMLSTYATQTYVDNAVSALPDSAQVATIVTSYGYTTFDSGNASGLITTAIDNLIDAAPSALDTLNELAAALGDDANFATTVTNAIAALPDSAQVATIVTSYGYTTYDSANTTGMLATYATQSYVDGAVAALPDSAQVATIVTSYGYSTYDSANFTGQLAAASTTDLSEGTNLYYTTARFDSDFNSKTTDDLTEGSTNLYYTNARVTTLVDSAYVQARQADIYRDSAFVTGIVDSAYIAARTAAGTDSATVVSLITGTVDSAYVLARTSGGVGLKFRQFVYEADSGDTTFTGVDTNGNTLSYVAGKIEVFYNGVLLAPSDYTASSGTSIVLQNAIDSGDTIIVSSYTTTSELDSAAVTSLVTSTVTSTVDSAYINARVSATDSAAVISIVTSTADSAYVQLRQDYAYSSLTGAPTNVSSFTNDAGYSTYDSANTTSIVTNTFIRGLIDDSSVIVDGNGSTGGVTIQDGGIEVRTGTSSVAYVDLYCEVNNAHRARIKSAPHSSYSGNVDLTLPVSTGTIALTSDIPVAGTDVLAYDANLQSFVTTFTLPTSDGTTGQALTTNGSGTLSFSDVASSGVDSAAIIALVDSNYVQARAGGGVGLKFRQFVYEADSGQTTFTGADDNGSTLAYVANKIQVYFNGVLLSTADYTATNGTSVVLAQGADSADVITVASYTTTSELDSTGVNNIVTSLVDSAYVAARTAAGTDSATVVTLITGTVDSAYVQARQTAGGSGGLDSAAVLALAVGGATAGVNLYEFTATASQTLFSGTDDNGATLAYTAGNILVHRNGILLVSTVDYTATNGTSMLLQAAADSGDTISITSYRQTLVELEEGTITSTVQEADSGQTSFTISHTQDQILVFLNGILLKDSDDYTSNGSTIVLTTGADSGDQLTVHNFSKFLGAGGTLSKKSYEFLATASQTTFTGTANKGGTLAYNAGNIDVFRNGVMLVDSADYTGTSGNSIVLTFGADSGDVISVRTYDASFVNPSPRVPVKPWAAKTAGYVAVPGDKLIVDTTSNTVAISLPSSPALGDEVKVVDGGGNAETNNITISRNGNKIMAADSDFILDVNWSAVELVYYNSTSGWVVTGT